MAVVALVVSVLALVVSGLSVYWTIRRDRKAEAEKKKASLRARLEWASEHQGSCDYLVVHNYGPVSAHSIEVLIDGDPLPDSGILAGNWNRIDTLGPESSCFYEVNWATTQSRELVVRWADASSKPGEFKTTVSPPPTPPRVEFTSFTE